MRRDIYHRKAVKSCISLSAFDYLKKEMAGNRNESEYRISFSSVLRGDIEKVTVIDTPIRGMINAFLPLTVGSIEEILSISFLNNFQSR